MSAAQTVTARRGNPATAAIPAFFLYGEPLQAPDERLIHIETIAARSRLHDWTIRPHRHRDLHQILVTQEGAVAVQLDEATRGGTGGTGGTGGPGGPGGPGGASGDSPLHLPAPALVVVPPGCVHAFRFDPGTVGFVVSFAPGLAAELSRPNPALGDFLDRPLASNLSRAAVRQTDLRNLCAMLLREFARAAPGRPAALRGLLGALLANAWRLCSDSVADAEPSPKAERELVARYRRLIEAHFREHRSVRAYAAELGSSESRLRRACLAVTGQSPVEVVHLRLLMEAERLLRYTTMPISQVAYHLGFEDPAYFSRFFTRARRRSPRAFRARDGAAGIPAR